MGLSTKMVRVPVKLVDGHWEVLYGGPVRVADGAVGELLLNKASFSDKAFLKALTEKRKVEVLPEGAELRVALSIRTPLAGLERHLIARKTMACDSAARIATATCFVPVRLEGATSAHSAKGTNAGGLTLMMEGMEPRVIESGQVGLPDIPSLGPVNSLNHAFNRLSELYEPWRKAHTGSIYERVFSGIGRSLVSARHPEGPHPSPGRKGGSSCFVGTHQHFTGHGLVAAEPTFRQSSLLT